MSNSLAQKNDKVCPKRKTLIMKERKKKKRGCHVVTMHV
jgi:hypothetical protein